MFALIWIKKMKRRINNIKVKYTAFERTKKTDKYFLYLSYLSKINHLLEVGLLTPSEHEKVKCVIEKMV